MLILTKIKWRLKTVVNNIIRRVLFFKRRLISPSLPKNIDGKVLVHIGCGEVKSQYFINIDIMPFPHVHFVTGDISNLNMFASNSVDLIYTSHVLEHFPRKDVIEVLWEMKRILKKGGVLRLSVPDFDKLVQIYIEGDRDVKYIHGTLMGGQDNKYDFHYSIFNKMYLTELLLKTGFNLVREWDPSQSNYYDFTDGSSAFIVGKDRKKYLISLNLEAIKI